MIDQDKFAQVVFEQFQPKYSEWITEGSRSYLAKDWEDLPDEGEFGKNFWREKADAIWRGYCAGRVRTR